MILNESIIDFFYFCWDANEQLMVWHLSARSKCFFINSHLVFSQIFMMWLNLISDIQMLRLINLIYLTEFLSFTLRFFLAEMFHHFVQLSTEIIWSSYHIIHIFFLILRVPPLMSHCIAPSIWRQAWVEYKLGFSMSFVFGSFSSGHLHFGSLLIFFSSRAPSIFLNRFLFPELLPSSCASAPEAKVVTLVARDLRIFSPLCTWSLVFFPSEDDLCSGNQGLNYKLFSPTDNILHLPVVYAACKRDKLDPKMQLVFPCSELFSPQCIMNVFSSFKISDNLTNFACREIIC